MDKRPTNVAIIGGGLAGPALALCLKKQHGIPCTVYEARGDADDGGVNIVLAPNAIRVLARLGVYDELRTLGFTFEDISMVSARTETQLGTFRNGSEEHYNFPCLRIYRGSVQKVLLQEAERQGIEVHYNKKLLRIQEETEDHVKLEFEGGEVTQADFVIGADGVWSRVRPFIDEVKLPYSGFCGILGMNMKEKTLHPSKDNFKLPMFCFGDTGMIAVFPTNPEGTLFDMFSTFPYPEQTRQEWEKSFEDRELKQKIMMGKYSQEGWPEFISRVYSEHTPDELRMHAFYEVTDLPRWSSPGGRVILMGDAAHAFSPQGGQGAAMAMEDAATLGMTLSRPNFTPDRVRLLKAWQIHRQRRVQAVKAYTDGNGKLRTPTNTWFKRFVKEWVMWAKLTWKGPLNGMEWLFSYDAEDVVKDLRV